MANLLSLRFGWRDVTPLFAEGDTEHTRLRRGLDEALNAARVLPALEDCTEEQADMPMLREANRLALAIPPSPGRTKRAWGPVAVSKVLHRLAPTVPLIDSYVRAFFGRPSPDAIPRLLRAELIRNRDWLTQLAREHSIRGNPLPLARVADIAIWMDSRST